MLVNIDESCEHAPPIHLLHRRHSDVEFIFLALDERQGAVLQGRCTLARVSCGPFDCSGALMHFFSEVCMADTDHRHGDVRHEFLANTVFQNLRWQCRGVCWALLFSCGVRGAQRPD